MADLTNVTISNIFYADVLLRVLKDLNRQVISGLTSALHYKGTVPSAQKLPANAEIGDVWNVLDTGANYAWSGEDWDKLSEIIDLTPYLLTADAKEMFASKYDLQKIADKMDSLDNTSKTDIQKMIDASLSNYVTKDVYTAQVETFEQALNAIGK